MAVCRPSAAALPVVLLLLLVMMVACIMLNAGICSVNQHRQTVEEVKNKKKLRDSKDLKNNKKLRGESD